jgi:hypothetical protein
MASSHRKRRSDAGLIRATQRDLTILAWIGDMYALRIDHLQVLAARESEQTDNSQLTLRAVQYLVDRWRRAGWVETRKLLVGEPGWVWLTSEGARMADVAFPARMPSVARLAHIHAVNQVRMYVEEAASGAEWESDRRINADRKELGKRHLVDGLVHLSGDTAAIEVEITAKNKRRLRSILMELTQDYESVWYFVASDCQSLVEDMVLEIEERRGRKVFAVYLLADLLYGRDS